jgi:hypothetical protein
MKTSIALAAGIAAAALLGSGALAAAPTQGLSRLYASDVTGAPQSVVHDAASAYAWLASMNGSQWGTEKDPAAEAAFKAATASLHNSRAAEAAAAPAAPAAAAPKGEPVGATFKTIASGSTVMEVYLPGSPTEMTIMYHMDGPTTLLANHFCAARNVPQWKFVKNDQPGVITFAFDGGTNINPATDPYAYAVTYKVIDKDHYEENLTNSIGGQFHTFHSVHYRMPAAPIQSASAQ